MILTKPKRRHPRRLSRKRNFQNTPKCRGHLKTTYTRNSSKVQYGPGLYQGYFAAALGADPMGLAIPSHTVAAGSLLKMLKIIDDAVDISGDTEPDTVLQPKNPGQLGMTKELEADIHPVTVTGTSEHPKYMCDPIPSGYCLKRFKKGKIRITSSVLISTHRLWIAYLLKHREYKNAQEAFESTKKHEQERIDIWLGVAAQWAYEDFRISKAKTKFSSLKECQDRVKIIHRQMSGIYIDGYQAQGEVAGALD